MRNYGWYWVNQGGKSLAAGSDCDNSTRCQVYGPDYTIAVPATNNAVDAVAAAGWYQNGTIFQSQYLAGRYDQSKCLNPQDSPYADPNNCMTQNGSHYWADQGMGYQWILNHYYISPAPTYFTMAPTRTNPVVVGTGPNYVTLGYATPGATQYAVFKWMNNTWTNVYYGTSNIYTDSSATAGQLTYYTVLAGNNAGWGPQSYDRGYLSIVPKLPASTPTPSVTPFFITDKEVRIRTTSIDTNVSQYNVWKVVGSSWTQVYNGPNNIFADTGVSANTGYNYAVAVYDASKGWSDFVYVTPVTYPTY